MKDSPIEEVNPDIESIVKGNTAFALDLYERLKPREDNLFFSPYSISLALAMAYAGARKDTERQIAQVLHFTSGQEQLHQTFACLEMELKAVQDWSGILLRTANSLWPQTGYPLLEEFLNLVNNSYGVVVTAVDYQKDPEAAENIINAWVAEKTQDKIQNLIPSNSLNELTRLVLVNAIYFQGDWKNKFDNTLTETAPFWITSAKKIQVPMMEQKETFGYKETEDLQVLQLPYVGNDLSMLVLLPKQINGLRELEDNLTLENLANWVEGLQEREVRVFLPRFRVSSQFQLNETLIAMGMRDGFDQNKANFSGMDGRENGFCIGAVVHQAFVDVNDEGTEAAAATAMGMFDLFLSEQPLPVPVFKVDRPFIFLIRERITASILFLGKIVNPEKSL
ncbi:MAG: serpin family protein [Nostoc sp. DedQUE05]|uniref:serpin family protein n=1 Tax=Nostoc sp. DedQUE05 TaxID=3075391 RepID=UPI002AD3C4D1|nr:serpin family protein [Nostoc sp. DedQUE05]MDZ8092544.1 serpin family protein [Nostoc sp. DedQUE05]